MTQLLDKALAEVQKPPTSDQDAIAAIILNEIADERQWDEAFSKSQDQLGRFAEHVRQQIASGKLRTKGIDEL